MIALNSVETLYNMLTAEQIHFVMEHILLVIPQLEAPNWDLGNVNILENDKHCYSYLGNKTLHD